MGRWVIFFVFTFICGNLIAGSIDTQAAYAVTRLDGSISEDAITLTVDDTTNFPGASTPDTARCVYVGDEVVYYTTLTSTTFTGLTRGGTDPQTGRVTQADSHSDNTRVKTLMAQTISSVGAINLITSGVSFGSLTAYVLTGTALRDIFKTLTWDYPWFEGNMIFARIPLFAISAGFLWTIAIAMIALANGIFR